MSEQDNKYVDDVDEEMVVDITNPLMCGWIAQEVNEQSFSFNASKKLRAHALPVDGVKNE